MSLTKKLTFLKMNFIDNREKIIPIKKNEFKIGRNTEPFVDYRIVDGLISRTHIVLKKGSLGEWTIQNLSPNCIVVNEEEIFQTETRPLVAGSIFKLRTSDGFCSFEFGEKEISNEKIEALRYGTKKRKENSEEVEEAHNNEIKRKMKEKLELEEKLREEERNRLLILEEKLALELKQEKEEMLKKFEDEQREREEQLLNEKEELRKKLLVIEEQNAKLENEMKNREETRKNVQDSKRKEEEEKKLALEDLEKDKKSLEMRLEILQNNLEEKDLLTSTLTVELKQKEETERRLISLMEEKQNLETKLLEADKAGEQVSDLQKRLTNLEAEKCSLQQQASKEVVDSITDVVENEFQCSICNEILMTAMILNCSHVFCKFCIDSWKRTKRECPNCRASITTENRAYVLDNFIDKIVSRLSEDLKLRRKNTIVEREAELKAFNQRTEVAASVSNQRRGRQRGRGRGRGNGPQGRSIPTSIITTTTRPSASVIPSVRIHTVGSSGVQPPTFFVPQVQPPNTSDPVQLVFPLRQPLGGQVSSSTFAIRPGTYQFNQQNSFSNRPLYIVSHMRPQQSTSNGAGSTPSNPIVVDSPRR